jgi:hypothetical protein
MWDRPRQKDFTEKPSSAGGWSVGGRKRNGKYKVGGKSIEV